MSGRPSHRDGRDRTGGDGSVGDCPGARSRRGNVGSHRAARWGDQRVPGGDGRVGACGGGKDRSTARVGSGVAAVGRGDGGDQGRHRRGGPDDGVGFEGGSRHLRAGLRGGRTASERWRGDHRQDERARAVVVAVDGVAALGCDSQPVAADAHAGWFVGRFGRSGLHWDGRAGVGERRRRVGPLPRRSDRSRRLEVATGAGSGRYGTPLGLARARRARAAHPHRARRRPVPGRRRSTGQREDAWRDDEDAVRPAASRRVRQGAAWHRCVTVEGGA